MMMMAESVGRVAPRYSYSRRKARDAKRTDSQAHPHDHRQQNTPRFPFPPPYLTRPPQQPPHVPPPGGLLTCSKPDSSSASGTPETLSSPSSSAKADSMLPLSPAPPPPPSPASSWTTSSLAGAAAVVTVAVGAPPAAARLELAAFRIFLARCCQRFTFETLVIVASVFVYRFHENKAFGG